MHRRFSAPDILRASASRLQGVHSNPDDPRMSTALLTPRMRGLLDRIERARRAPLHTLTPKLARVAYDQAAEILDLPRAPLARVMDFELPVAPGVQCPARLYAASHARLPVLLYLHGGGFTIGSLETHDSLCRQLALRSGVAVVALAYRLAPEHRFPVAVDDSFAALRWLHLQAEAQLGLDGTRLAIGGDSAGGTLAAVGALLARDTGLPLALAAPDHAGHHRTGRHPLRTACSRRASCSTR